MSSITQSDAEEVLVANSDGKLRIPGAPSAEVEDRAINALLQIVENEDLEASEAVSAARELRNWLNRREWRDRSDREE